MVRGTKIRKVPNLGTRYQGDYIRPTLATSFFSGNLLKNKKEEIGWEEGFGAELSGKIENELAHLRSSARVSQWSARRKFEARFYFFHLRRESSSEADETAEDGKERLAG